MTSSLVGSEMCIRYSSMGGLPAPDCPHCGRLATTWHRFWECPAWEAVSYTHLTLPTICSV
eukprot:2921048-Prorocentrum_lima.AAC.1